MRRITGLISASIFAPFVFGAPHLFAAGDEFSGNNAGPGLISAIVAVVIPAVVLVAIGMGVYSWFRRNKGGFLRIFPKPQAAGKWKMSQQSVSPSPASGGNSPPRPKVVERRTQPDPQRRRDASSLEVSSLRELEQTLSLLNAGRIQQYYQSIAVVIKRYVGEKYGVKTVDATTGRILAALPGELTDVVADHVGEILRACDMVQFSRHRPSRAEINGIYQTAKEFLESQIVEVADEPDEEEADDDPEIPDFRWRV